MWRRVEVGAEKTTVCGQPDIDVAIVLHNISSSTSNSMSRRPNAHRYTESTASIVAAANQTLEGATSRPGASRSTSDSVLDSGAGQDRRQTARVNRRSGGVFMYGSGTPAPDMLDHRATWAGNEHDDRHAWQQGYTFVRSSAAESAAQARADQSSNRFNGRSGQSRSRLLGSVNGTRELADAPMTDHSTRRSSQRHSPTASPVSHPHCPQLTPDPSPVRARYRVYHRSLHGRSARAHTFFFKPLRNLGPRPTDDTERVPATRLWNVRCHRRVQERALRQSRGC